MSQPVTQLVHVTRIGMSSADMAMEQNFDWSEEFMGKLWLR